MHSQPAATNIYAHIHSHAYTFRTTVPALFPPSKTRSSSGMEVWPVLAKEDSKLEKLQGRSSWPGKDYYEGDTRVVLRYQMTTHFPQ